MTSCAYCSQEISLEAKYCPNCGEAVTQADVLGDSKRNKATAWSIASIFIVGLPFLSLAILGLASIIVNAVSLATGEPEMHSGMGLLFWTIGFTYFFKNLGWKKSSAVKKHPNLSGIFASWLIASSIYAVIMIFVHKT